MGDILMLYDLLYQKTCPGSGMFLKVFGSTLLWYRGQIWKIFSFFEAKQKF